MCASAATARADTVHGTLVDRATQKPVGGAIITIGSEVAASDDDGAFTVTLPPGAYTAEIAAPFLVTAKVAVRATTRPVELGAIAGRGGRGARRRRDRRDHGCRAGHDRPDRRRREGRARPARRRRCREGRAVDAGGRAPADRLGRGRRVGRGPPGSTRTFVDGVPVPGALYHVGGYRSAVGNDLIGDIRLTPAAFGVDRGRAIGGVIDIGMADPASAPELAGSRRTSSTPASPARSCSAAAPR